MTTALVHQYTASNQGHRRSAPNTPLVVQCLGCPALVVAGIGAILDLYSDHSLSRGAVGRADVVLFDPATAGDEVAQQLRALPPSVRIVAITRDRERRDVRRAIELGAHGTVAFTLDAPDLVRAIEAVVRGTELPLAEPSAPSVNLRGEDLRLSPRELEILTLICRGLTNDEIASRLYLSVNSVKTYIRNAYRKVGVLRRAQAVSWGVTQGL